MLIRARFKDGVAVPDAPVSVPDGTEVGIIVAEQKGNGTMMATPELQDEFRYWESLSADAWEKFLEWEASA